MTRFVLAPLFLLALGCNAPGAGDGKVADSGAADTGDTAVDDTDDTDDTEDTDEPLAGEYNGDIPTNPVSLPTFAARNQYGEARSEADLVGHPTVLWFYPAAGTYG